MGYAKRKVISHVPEQGVHFASNSAEAFFWFVAKGNLLKGPYSTHELKGLIESSEIPSKSAAQTAVPTLFNYTLISSNNRGSLLYSLNYRYWFNDKLGTNASINYVYTEYRTADRLVFDNNRYRNKSFCFMLGVSYAPFHKKYKN